MGFCVAAAGHVEEGVVAGKGAAALDSARYPPGIATAGCGNAGVQRRAVLDPAGVNISRYTSNLVAAVDTAGAVAVRYRAANTARHTADILTAVDAAGAVAVFYRAGNTARHAADLVAAKDAGGAVAILHRATGNHARHAADNVAAADAAGAIAVLHRTIDNHACYAADISAAAAGDADSHQPQVADPAPINIAE